MIEVIFTFINSTVSKKSIQHDNFMHIFPLFRFSRGGGQVPPPCPCLRAPMATKKCIADALFLKEFWAQINSDPNREVLSNCLNCLKLMSVCLSEVDDCSTALGLQPQSACLQSGIVVFTGVARLQFKRRQAGLVKRRRRVS